MRSHLALIVCGLFSSSTTLALASVLFTDSTFNDSDWNLAVFTQNAGGTMSASQLNAGGNLGACRQILNSVPTSGGDLGFHSRVGATYAPRVSGAVEIVNYSEDAIMFAEYLNGMRTGPALLQDGKIFVYDVLRTPETNWTHKVASNLRATNFVLVDAAFPSLENTSVHPDFSASALPMQFGFFRANGNPGNRDGAIDNWSLEVIQAAPILTNMRVNGGLPAFDLLGVTGRTYRVEFTPSIQATNWTPLTNVSLTTSEAAVSDTTAIGVGARFYRAVRLQ